MAVTSLPCYVRTYPQCGSSQVHGGESTPHLGRYQGLRTGRILEPEISQQQHEERSFHEHELHLFCTYLLYTFTIIEFQGMS